MKHVDEWLTQKKDTSFVFDPSTQIKDCVIINSFTRDKTKENQHHIYLRKIKDAMKLMLPQIPPPSSSSKPLSKQKNLRFKQKPQSLSPSPPNPSSFTESGKYMKISFMAKENETFKKLERKIYSICNERKEFLKQASPKSEIPKENDAKMKAKSKLKVKKVN